MSYQYFSLKFFAFRLVLLYVCLVMTGLKNEALSQERIMSYNLLNYPGSDSVIRNPYFRQVIDAVDPDILVVEEITSQDAVDGFLKSVLNFSDTLYAAGVYINGFDSDNAIFYKKDKFSFLSNTPIPTDLRDINEFVMLHKTSGLSLHIFNVHLRSSSGQQNEDSRAQEIDSLRKFTNQFPAETEFIVCGDFNIYNSNETAYQKLLSDSGSIDGHFIDPVVMNGNWNDPAYAVYHTQSPRNRLFGGGIAGGMNDRFDLMLNSKAVMDSGGIEYIDGSLTAFGNDGNHYNDSINSLPNTAVTAALANAIAYASDHIPVYSTYLFGNPDFTVVFTEFTAKLVENDVLLNWTTSAESNLKGFHIERRKKNQPWYDLVFVNGHGNTSATHHYDFTDKSLETSGTYYYRLKTEDYKGLFTFSDAKEINFNKYFDETAIEISPMPFSNELNVSLADFNYGKLSIQVTDVTGKVVLSESALEVVDSKLYLDFSKLSKGFYFLDLSDGNKHGVKKLIKQ